jgi:hypothetical protein
MPEARSYANAATSALERLIAQLGHMLYDLTLDELVIVGGID